MYPGEQARLRPDHPAIIMAASGETLTYGELERRSNRLAHFMRRRGLRRLDHFSVFMENHVRFIECCAAGDRSGLYTTCINSFLTPEEVAYILENSCSRLLITSQAKRETALRAIDLAPGVEVCLVVDGPGEGDRVLNLDEALRGLPETPIADESLGTAMLYSSGTTGRPKGILRPLPEAPPAEYLPIYRFLDGLWRYREGMVYLSPAPLYHSAPHTAVGLTLRRGGTAVIMERFDPEQYLALIERWRVTHSQLVPTMFSRMLKLPEETRHAYDLSSLEIAIHAAAPCPPQVKHAMIDSFAAAHVSGLVALARERAGGRAPVLAQAHDGRGAIDACATLVRMQGPCDCACARPASATWTARR
jgi:long-chain acyl-CoA synthetase